jgi:hypothetical protein
MATEPIIVLNATFTKEHQALGRRSNRYTQSDL